MHYAPKMKLFQAIQTMEAVLYVQSFTLIVSVRIQSKYSELINQLILPIKLEECFC